MKFWDSSAIIPLCFEESQSFVLKELLQRDQNLIVWWATIIECLSALARLKREGILSEKEERQALDILNVLAGTWAEVEPTEQVRQGAERLLRLHSLTAADSLQLAAAWIWAEKNPHDYNVFVCLDKRLRQAAYLEGFSLLPENV